MPTLTIRNVPDDLHARLKERARRNRRSLNQEVIAELDAGISQDEMEVERIALVRERVRRANEAIETMREGMTRFLTADETREAIDEGRA